MATVKQIFIDGITYEVKNDFLHRGQNPRLELVHKEKGVVIKIQFNNTSEAIGAIAAHDLSETFNGYWVTYNNFREVKIQITEIIDMVKNKETVITRNKKD